MHVWKFKMVELLDHYEEREGVRRDLLQTVH
jgi:hypothetical protein